MSTIKTTRDAPRVFLHGALADGTPAAVDVDNSSHGLVLIDHAHHKLHEGKRFEYCDAITLGAASQDYLITVPNTAELPHFTYAFDGTAVTACYLYEATDRSGTTLQSTFNRNRNSATTAGVTVHKGVSGGTTDGTLLCAYASGTATGNGSNFSTSGGGNFSNERVLRKNTKYLLRITSGTAGNLCNLALDWYEHTDITP